MPRTPDRLASRSFRPERSTPGSSAAYWLGLLCLLISVAASGVLAWTQLTGTPAPGCGVGSDCEAATRSAWGGIPLPAALAPGLRVPVSLIGLAYFITAAIGWFRSRNGMTAGFGWVVRLSAAISLLYLCVIVLQGHLCPYCIAGHVGNFGFFAVVEASRPVQVRRRGFVAVHALIFLVILGLLMGFETARHRAALRRAEAEATQSAQRVIEHSIAPAQTQPVIEPPTQSGADRVRRGFTGRYRLGPENAPIRIVIISDYQCPDCQKIEAEVRQVMRERGDVSLSAKHFPLNPDCNSHAVRMHDNACWAARAAEAAGILRGNDGFWKMHFWLFDHEGEFETEADLDAGLIEQGYDEAARLQFKQALQGEETLRLVRADIAEAVDLGLHFTPMIFINGVEVRGFVNNPGALKRAVERIAAINPPPGTAAQDQPPLAPVKHIADWQAMPALRMPADSRDWSLGRLDAPIQIVVWSDYQFKGSSDIDLMIRAAMEGRDDIRYSFRHYPVNQSCNPNVPKTQFEHSCRASSAVEAAGVLGGGEAYWKMHDWLLAHQADISDAALQTAAAEIGLNGESLLQSMNAPEVTAAITEDVAAGRPFIQQGVPSIYINGKWVPRWRLEGHNVIQLIIDSVR